MTRPVVAGYQTVARGEETLVLHLAPVFRKIPVVGVRCSMPWILWQGFIPGQSVAFSWGSALSEEGAKSKVWSAFDAWAEGRRRWNTQDDPFTSNNLRSPFSKD